MNRLKEFNNSFVNIILSLIVALLLSYLFFPETAWMQKDKRTCDYVLAGGLLIFLVKWLHESSVSAHRFKDTNGEHPGGKYQAALFFSRVGIPLASLFVVTLLLRRDTETLVGGRALLLGSGLLLLHSFLYCVPDVYLKKVKPQLPKEAEANANWDPDRTIKVWLRIDLSVIILAIIVTAVGGWWTDKITGERVKFAFGSVIILQTIADWLLNWKFFFADRQSKSVDPTEAITPTPTGG
jgi:hypothetical protein